MLTTPFHWYGRVAHTCRSLLQVVHDVYLQNVVVMDMDWHIEPTTAGCQSWGGFTFNTDLFPDPQVFIAWLNSSASSVGHRLKLSLNVHPQTGIDHCQARYAEAAEMMGIDPSTNATVPCDMGNLSFVNTLYSVYYDAEPLSGVSYWWTDYGGCGGPSNANLLWSNIVYDSHTQYVHNKRPLTLSRYGGIGNHRYAIGFSGDTFQDVSALSWEIAKTSQAANVGFGYWSHDIGGFHNGQGCPGDATPSNITGSEVFLRWVQFGSVSPIMRTHCDHCIRTIWSFTYHFQWLRDAFYLRNALGPYLYTHARVAYDSGVATVHPLYYDFPADSNAFAYSQTEYAFGDAILASPITNLVDSTTNSTTESVWIPSGLWSNWNGTAVIQGPTVSTVTYGLGDIPLFVKAGSLVPLQTMASVFGNFADPLLWTAWTGATTGTGSLYEDDGDALDYMKGEYASTTASYTAAADGSSWTVVIAATSGSFAGMPATRNYGVQLRVGGAYTSVTKSTCNGSPVPQVPGPSPDPTAAGWYFVNATAHSLAAPAGSFVLTCGELPISATTTIAVTLA
jgi:alpha-glucosidase (family GH31 glycosyl hydrolase)